MQGMKLKVLVYYHSNQLLLDAWKWYTSAAAVGAPDHPRKVEIPWEVGQVRTFRAGAEHCGLSHELLQFVNVERSRPHASWTSVAPSLTHSGQVPSQIPCLAGSGKWCPVHVHGWGQQLAECLLLSACSHIKKNQQLDYSDPGWTKEKWRFFLWISFSHFLRWPCLSCLSQGLNCC